MKHYIHCNIRIVCISLVVSIAVSVIGFGCDFNSKKSPKIGNEKGNTVIYGDTNSLNGLQPCIRGRLNEPSIYLSELVFDGLVNKVGIDEKSGQQKFMWTLADGWKEYGFTTEEKLMIQVDLHPAARWHDGREFTAEDVIYSWEALQASNAPMMGWLTSFIKEMKIIDKRTILVNLHIERSEEVVMELLSSFKILPRKIGNQMLPVDLNSEGIAKDFTDKPIGTGPYKVVDLEKDTAKLVVNDNYFLGPPKIQEFSFRRYQDYSVLLKKMLDREVSITMNIHPESGEILEKGSLRRRVIFPYSFHAIVYNFKRHPFNELRFRQAVNHATDKVALANIMFPSENAIKFINASIFPHNYQFVMDSKNNEFSSRTPLNPRRARELLGQSSQGNEFTLLISSEAQGANVLNMARAFKDMMSKVGLNVTISDQSKPQFDAMIIQRNYDAVYKHFKGLDHFFDIRSLFDSRNRQNVLHFENRTLDNLLEKFGETISYDLQAQNTKAIHNLVEKFVPACFLYTLPTYTYFDDRMGSVIIHPEVGFAKAYDWTF